MTWEIWDTVSRNIVSDFETEAGAIAYVRTLMSQGWKTSELMVILDDPAIADDDLPPAITGDELASRVDAARRDSVRRTA
ncbi:MAG: hypothetical protein AB7K36_05565 [Chloroflexota bacterium]